MSDDGVTHVTLLLNGVCRQHRSLWLGRTRPIITQRHTWGSGFQGTAWLVRLPPRMCDLGQEHVPTGLGAHPTHAHSLRAQLLLVSNCYLLGPPTHGCHAFLSFGINPKGFQV